MNNIQLRAVAIATVALFSMPVSGYAWNIICGVSVLSFGDVKMSSKWEADSVAIRGISEFYKAISELQNINVEIALAPASADKLAEITKIQSATTALKASASSFQSAVEKANALSSAANPMDSIGKQSIALWKKMSDYNTAFAKALDGGMLPDLYELHEAIDVVHQIDNLGMRASLMHLNQHKDAHTAGGHAATFK
ncbi:Hypothetical protein NGAL_HAMBI2610_48880 [Neorhizobium galegae bv. orientalis]|nr:Hypothetical protein NGAL_HAMBI2610_48880 [Neorhizobium galegae bv. orientalis]